MVCAEEPLKDPVAGRVVQSGVVGYFLLHCQRFRDEPATRLSGSTLTGVESTIWTLLFTNGRGSRRRNRPRLP